MRTQNKLYLSCALVFALLLAGCTTPPAPPNQNNNNAGNTNQNTGNGNKAGGHEHTAPHGGTLIGLGEEFAHLELVLDESTGKITAYALDGEAEKAVPLKQETIEIEVKGSTLFTVKLNAVENKLTGETKGNTSQFEAVEAKLKGLQKFDAVLKAISIKGKDFKTVEFKFPEGNEHAEEHKDEKGKEEKKEEHKHK